jgi:hypothetical protein
MNLRVLVTAQLHKSDPVHINTPPRLQNKPRVGTGEEHMAHVIKTRNRMGMQILRYTQDGNR